MDFTKGKRSDQIVNQDNSLIEDIDNNLISINAKIDDISYIKKSLDSINTEMETLSVNNQNKKLRFSSISSDAEQLIDNVELIYETDDKKLTLGGDGRNNQIYLSTWISKQKELADDKSITFYALEEPEAHLHPQQQVRLARHIFDNLDQQILITSHSPSIANEINPGNIIRLYSSDSKSSIAANEGINEELINFFNDFAHRRNLINSQLYFLNSVLLVEGVSEVIFYKTLAKSKSIDLNQYNTEILSVEGVGFEPYAQICLSLKIPFSIRTDNDLNKIQNKTGMLRFSGINRLINLLNNLNYSIDFLPYSPIDYETIKKDISFKEGKKPSTLSNSMPIPEFINKLSKHNLYLATEDLEKDIIDSPLFSSLKEFYNETDRDIIYEKMCKKKGENMFNFSQSYFSEFEKIPDTSILFAPLLSILDLSIGETNE
ncbi:ATP-dependent nuclease [Aerococcus sanguinicola]|uniref:ATP-dependent nuclease n=1 Tax=Aerococcus sanguinicola TaxID=119206 RepID=UPI00399007EB